MKRIIPLLWSCIIFPIALHAQCKPEASRPVTSCYSIETGRQNIIATYLSPLHYSGTNYGLSGSWSKAMPFNPEKAIMHFNASALFSNLLNPAQTARMIGLNISYQWGLSWRTKLPWQIQATAGGTIGADGGAYYLMRNGNNPVQAMASTTLGIRGSLSKPIRIKKLPILLANELSLPSFGLFFCPGYGETYYEIYLGNHSGLCHVGWWGNNFRLSNLLTATMDFGRTAVQIGYRFAADTQWSNNLNTVSKRHMFVIGVIPGGIGLAKKRTPTSSSAIYSIY